MFSVQSFAGCMGVFQDHSKEVSSALAKSQLYDTVQLNTVIKDLRPQLNPLEIKILDLWMQDLSGTQHARKKARMIKTHDIGMKDLIEVEQQLFRKIRMKFPLESS